MRTIAANAAIRFHVPGFFPGALAIFLSGIAPAHSATDFSEPARALKSHLSGQVMPYWFDTAQDKEHGGYVLADDLKGRGVAKEKQIVSQARMVWGFSHAHRKGLSDDRRNYLKAAEQGRRFLLEHFLDRENGGYFWTTDLSGKVLNDRKILYGEAFVIYAFVEYSRASGDREALRQALDLYQALQQHAHDAQHTGWFEHFTRDWKPIMSPDARIEVEVGGLKSANAHLHWMEALTELFEATHDQAVKQSLEEALKINATWFYPRDAGKSCFHRQPDWTPVTDPNSAGLSYGHNVEFAWLMIRYGYDHERGGLYSRGLDDQPATQTDKVWWVQAEMLAALTVDMGHRPTAASAEALEKLLRFVSKYQADPADGIWLDTVDAQGRPKATGKAHNWKANYHDVRAMVKFIETFSAAGK